MPTLRPSAPSNPEKPAPCATARSRAPVDPWSDTCPSRDVIGLLASKWVALLIPLLRRGPRRNGELMRGIAGVSQKMLTQTLRELEGHGLIARRDFGEVPPRVEYALTHRARRLGDPPLLRHGQSSRVKPELLKTGAIPA